MTALPIFTADELSLLDRFIASHIDARNQFATKSTKMLTSLEVLESIAPTPGGTERLAKLKARRPESIAVHEGEIAFLEKLRPIVANHCQAPDAMNGETQAADTESTTNTASTQPTDNPVSRMTSGLLASLIAACDYEPGGEIAIQRLERGFLIRVSACVLDVTAVSDSPPHHWQLLPPPERQSGRWWYVSPHSTNSEVIQTVWLAWKTFNEHELREKFTYLKKPIFHPHYDLPVLALASQQQRDLRDPASQAN